MRDHIDINKYRIKNENGECVARLYDETAALAAAKVLCGNRSKDYEVHDFDGIVFKVRPVVRVEVEYVKRDRAKKQSEPIIQSTN
jgi:hypothetical protein